MHTIFEDEKHFSSLTLLKANVNTISVAANMTNFSGRANIMLPRETKFVLNDTLFLSRSKRNLLNFKYIRRNRYHVETINEINVDYLYTTSRVFR